MQRLMSMCPYGYPPLQHCDLYNNGCISITIINAQPNQLPLARSACIPPPVLLNVGCPESLASSCSSSGRHERWPDHHQLSTGSSQSLIRGVRIWQSIVPVVSIPVVTVVTFGATATYLLPSVRTRISLQTEREHKTTISQKRTTAIIHKSLK